MDITQFSERDICTKFITPALEKAQWDIQTQIMEEVYITAGRITIRGKKIERGERKRADYILYYKPNIPIAVIEAKDATHSVSDGIQQALEYASLIDVPFIFSSNGSGFYFHDKTVANNIEQELSLDSFPPPDQLWEKYKAYRNISHPAVEKIVSEDYHLDASGYQPRYYQQIAINRSIEAIAKGEQRVLLVMATGTGKTFTAFQIAYRLWKAGARKRILFLADRNALIDQARRKDFKHFRDKMMVVKNREVDKSYEVYLALYQGLSGSDEEANIYKQFSPEFFDLVIVDECHRGSAREDSAWRDILTYFNKATHIGLTATPKETNTTSNIEYFGEPIYTYSLRQGIDDGFLAPYKVLRVGLNIDLDGWRPPKGFKDKNGNPVEDRIYNRTDFDKHIVVEERRKLVAKKVSEFLGSTNRFDKSIVFCVDTEHAQGMRNELANANADLVAQNDKYVMQITGDNEEGKRELDNFTNPEERYPVIATTSKLMTTGIDAPTCKVIILDSNIQSMTEFKQIIGRGTRIDEDNNKHFFTIIDFRSVTDLFADPTFDGDPIRVKTVKEGEPLIDEDEIVSADPPLPVEPPRGYTIGRPDGGIVAEPRKKVFVNGIDVSVLIERILYFDKDGKQITVSLKDYTRQTIHQKYATLNQFLNDWNSAERKQVIIDELEKQGVLVDELQNAVSKDLDLFDIICHTAFDMPPLTRRERTNNVKKRNYFTKYGEQARMVIEKLLEKYADEGIENIESLDILRIQPFTEIGSPMEILQLFGGREKYLQAVKELENYLYQNAA
ncbi:MAG: EcoAI/FtnUII family type I restriction enzme subunit R [Bacteroidota bacterium]